MNTCKMLVFFKNGEDSNDFSWKIARKVHEKQCDTTTIGVSHTVFVLYIIYL